MTKEQQELSFDNLGIRPNLLKSLKNKGFNTPTPIQHQVIPQGIEGSDIIGIAQTGTGKTLAFGISMIQHIANMSGQGLVITPTRELAVQVEKELQKIAGAFGLKTALIMGSVPQHKQVKALKRKPHIIVATPGRLWDLMDQKLLSPKNIVSVALDEADRMLDIGFLPQIKQILSALPQEKQMMLFSATMPQAISKLAAQFMHLPLRIEIAPQGTSSKNIEQEMILVNKKDKLDVLINLLKKSDDKSVLIFSRTKYGATKIARSLRKSKITATEIHSNRSQAQRQHALKGFTKGKFRVLVATDIVARGIDVKSITLVVNYDLPDHLEDYVHRIGRTGRADRFGKAISFVASDQKRKVKQIERIIKKTIPFLSKDGEVIETSSKRGSRQRKSSDSNKSKKSSDEPKKRHKNMSSSRKRKKNFKEQGQGKAKRKRKRKRRKKSTT